jgi:hypothetical protein
MHRSLGTLPAGVRARPLLLTAVASQCKQLRRAFTWPVLYTCLFLLVLVSRLPFLEAGYGLNIDAWRVARAAQTIATTGQYSVSRFPGYPLQEIICALFWRGGPWALNGLTALFSGLAFAATPVFFVSSVCSKDYVWALAFVLLSLLSALNGRIAVAGVFLGVATGCRITSAAMALPIAILIFNTADKSSTAIAKLILSWAGVALLAFLPVWTRYGIGFLTFYGDHARPAWDTVLSRATFQVWGSLGLIGLGIAALGAGLCWRRTRSNQRGVIGPLLLVVGIYIAAYLRLPDRAGYLLPAVPAILLLTCLFTPRPMLRVSFACLLLASVVDLTPKGVRAGPILVDRDQRLQNLINIGNFLQLTDNISGHNVFVVGDSEPEIAVLAPHLLNGRNHYLYVIDAEGAKTAIDDNRSLYYLPPMRKFNYDVNGVDVAEYGGHDLQSVFEMAAHSGR